MPNPFSFLYGWRLANDWIALTKQVKEANDIVDVIGGYVSLLPAGNKFKGLCPFHDDHHPSFCVDPQWQNFRCWSCAKKGDVLTFIQERERVNFREALELLARRAGITLEKAPDSPHNRGRALMLDVVRWAVDQYHHCLLDSPLAENARRYLGERKLTGETVRRFALGYAPLAGDWLAQRAAATGLSDEVMEQVGLLARRNEGNGHYDRFRDRVMFPIRDARGAPVAFGGRILPGSPLVERAPKYYNSADTPLFTKREHLYGLDQARQASAQAGYLAVVEGYTDVLMAHQAGIPQVVATMGTALNVSHVRHLRRFAPRVVLVYDADAGGNSGVDRALEIFAGEDVELAIATLPDGLDPCDLLVRENGPEQFRQVLASAADALDFKLNHLLAGESAAGVEGRRRAVDAVLGIIALAPEMSGQTGAVKRELMVSRIAQRLALREETVWARLDELRAARKASETARPHAAPEAEERKSPALPHERQLLQLLLAEPTLVAAAREDIRSEEIAHPGLRRLLDELYALHQAGQTPDLDALRVRIMDVPRLAQAAWDLQEVGRLTPNRPACYRELLAEFRRLRAQPRKQELHNQLQAAADHEAAVELLRQLQNQTVGVRPDVSVDASGRS